MIVTIGRQNGSGGREVGRILAEKMGVPCYDREIVEETARRSGRSIDDVERQEEVAHSESRLYFGGVPPASHMFEEQAAVIRHLASNGPCVFVGRSADYILRDRDDVVSVFITAPVPDRIKRSAARNGISEKNAYERITTKDRPGPSIAGDTPGGSGETPPTTIWRSTRGLLASTPRPRWCWSTSAG